MLLSIKQRYIRELLQKLGCLRCSQIGMLLRLRFMPTNEGFVRDPEYLDGMLRSMRHCVGDILRLEGDTVCWSRAEPDPLWLEAVDIMLELAGGRLPEILPKQERPVLLRFSFPGERLTLFAVALYSGQSVQELELSQRSKTERIIWLSESGDIPAQLRLPPKHFFAGRQGDGTHRFFGGGDQ